jgi:ferredoxin
MAIKIRIQVDAARCDGFGNCVMSAPDIFDLDEDGRVRLKLEEVGAERFDAVRRAAYDCPVSAIAFTEE